MEQFRPKPLATAVSTIALDHQGFLGDTLREISTEKAGIMKPDVPVVLAPNQEAVIQNLIEIAKRVGVSQIIRAEDTQGYSEIWRHNTKTTQISNDEVRAQNSAMAFSLTWLALQQLGPLQNQDPASLLPLVRAFHAVPPATVWPGRVQDISIKSVIPSYKPLILLDGAHNAESAAALANTVRKRLGGGRPVTWVIAASQGKDITSMLRHFLSVQKPKYPSSVIATKFGPVDGMPWIKAMSPVEILDQVRKVSEESEGTRARISFHSATSDLRGALGDACDYASNNDGLVVVAGSLYLVGDVLRMIRAHGGKIA
jgi:folylpolyglutamate synthase